MSAKTTPQPELTGEEYDARFEQEVAVYIAMHPQLIEKYEGKWVAVYGGQVIDVDDDFATLYDRVLDKYGDDTPIFFHQVTREVFQIVNIPGIDID
ncbi:hypothetical protein HYR99_15220 [Candidatus Poribacteria bacterium]|nr:hypothetical protein [Candidatus Poribacteria bacterium]